MPIVTPGKVMLTLVGVGTIIGPFAADWSDSHVFNPRWPPHAKFHNGQTMTLGAALGFLSLYYTHRPIPLSNPTAARDSIRTAAVLGALYHVAALSATFYPGAAGVDPEFLEKVGTQYPQFRVFTPFAILAGLGGVLEWRRLGRAVVGRGR